MTLGLISAKSPTRKSSQLRTSHQHFLLMSQMSFELRRHTWAISTEAFFRTRVCVCACVCVAGGLLFALLAPGPPSFGGPRRTRPRSQDPEISASSALRLKHNKNMKSSSSLFRRPREAWSSRRSTATAPPHRATPPVQRPGRRGHARTGGDGAASAQREQRKSRRLRLLGRLRKLLRQLAETPLKAAGMRGAPRSPLAPPELRAEWGPLSARRAWLRSSPRPHYATSCHDVASMPGRCPALLRPSCSISKGRKKCRLDNFSKSCKPSRRKPSVTLPSQWHDTA